MRKLGTVLLVSCILYLPLIDVAWGAPSKVKKAPEPIDIEAWPDEVPEGGQSGKRVEALIPMLVSCFGYRQTTEQELNGDIQRKVPVLESAASTRIRALSVRSGT